MRSLVFLAALIVLVSGCSQTGRFSDPLEASEAQNPPPLFPQGTGIPNETAGQQLAIPADPCEGVACQPSTATCLDGFQASCSNSCSGGSCSSCVPDCPPCQEYWECAPWSACTAGLQERACSDRNNCGTLAAKPAETSRSCTAEAQGKNVVFSQVSYDARAPETEHEWFELYNPTPQQIALDGWIVSDNSYNRTLPAGTVLPSHSFLTVARDAAGFRSLYGCDPGIVLKVGLLSNTGDHLLLSGQGRAAVDFVAWESPGWDIQAGDGKSLVRKDPAVDTDSPDDWEAGPASPHNC